MEQDIAYNAIFKQTEGMIQVCFPDIEQACTFGNTWEDAYEMAVDVLASELANYKERPIATPISIMLDQYPETDITSIISVSVDEQTVDRHK